MSALHAACVCGATVTHAKTVSAGCVGYRVAEPGATFHRIQEGYPDGWPRAVFIDSEGEPTGVRCQPEEAKAIEAGAAALVEAKALRAAGADLLAKIDGDFDLAGTTAAIDALRALCGDGEVKP